MLIDKASLDAQSADFVKNRVAMQDEHMKTVWQKFDGNVRAIVPLFETEIRGLPMLKRLADSMFV
jgi:anion-transporting  ArsA/GET3 family ATPase